MCLSTSEPIVDRGRGAYTPDKKFLQKILVIPDMRAKFKKNLIHPLGERAYPSGIMEGAGGRM
jgi:hypothetical protein